MLIEKDEFLKYWESMIKYFPDGEGGSLRGHGSPMLDPEETWILLDRLEKNPPLNTILELGCCEGGGLKIWEQILPQNKNSLLISIDWGPNVLWDYQNSRVDIRIVKGDTHDEATRNIVKQMLEGRKVDFLFIDAQHWPKDVEFDFRDYGGFVRDNGIIGFHDTRLMRSFWDKFTGGMEDSTGENYHIERAIFHKEEIKYSLGTGIFWKLPNQTVFNFRD
jgi:hypothetical protein